MINFLENKTFCKNKFLFYFRIFIFYYIFTKQNNNKYIFWCFRDYFTTNILLL